MIFEIVTCRTYPPDLNRDQVIAAAFKPFEDRNVRTVDDRQLRYYGSWATRVLDVPRLLDRGDGVCDSWARLFVNILNTQGLTGYTYGNSIRTMRPPGGEFLLVNNWQFGAANIPNNLAPGYTHFNVPVANETLRVPNVLAASSAANAYQWRGSAAPAPAVVDGPGVSGQGQADPHSMFNVHIVVQLWDAAAQTNDPTRIIDPSYGIIYPAVGNGSAVQAFEDTAIAGYVSEIRVLESAWMIDLDGNGSIGQMAPNVPEAPITIFVFRQRRAGQYGIRNLPYIVS